jgi:hypothetical protein
MHDPTKMDYSKLFGFDTVIDNLAKGIDFRDPTIGAKLGAKVGTKTITEMMMPMPPRSKITGPAAPIMRGLGGRKITSG